MQELEAIEERAQQHLDKYNQDFLYASVMALKLAKAEENQKRQQDEIDRLRGELKALRDELIGAAYESEANPSFDPLPTLDALADHIRQIL